MCLTWEIQTHWPTTKHWKLHIVCKYVLLRLLHFNLLYYQVEMSSSLSGEITNTRAKTKRNVRLFHVGRKGKFFHSSAKSILMVERASSFPGTNSIERFTNKLCCITLIQTRKGKSSNISRHFQFK